MIFRINLGIWAGFGSQGMTKMAKIRFQQLAAPSRRPECTDLGIATLGEKQGFPNGPGAGVATARTTRFGRRDDSAQAESPFCDFLTFLIPFFIKFRIFLQDWSTKHDDKQDY